MLSPAQLKKNAVYHVLDGIFFFAGLIMFSRQVTMPAMITELSDSVFLVGLVHLVAWLCLLVPQVLYAKRVEGRAYLKTRVMLWVVVQRIGWVMFFCVLFSPWRAGRILPALYVALAIGAIGSGLAIPAWTDYYAKTVPDHMWGRILGIRRAASGFLGVGLGFLINYIMDTFAGPVRYRLLVGISLVFYLLSAICVVLVKEEPTAGLPNHRDTPLSDYLKGLAWILFRRRDFRKFMAAALVACVPLMLMDAFLAKYGLTHPESRLGITGTFTMILFGPAAVGSIIGGVLSDRRHSISAFRVFPLFGLGAAAIAACSNSPAFVSAALCLHGFAMGMRMVVMIPVVFRYAGPNRRPSYTAVSFTILGLLNALLPPVFGWLIDLSAVTFQQMFVLAGLLSLVGWLIFLRIQPPESDTSKFATPHS